VQYWWQKGRCEVWLRVSTRAIKTIEKHGLEEAAKKFNLNLTDYTLPFSEPRVIL
jgi:ribosomal protein L28